VSDVHAEADATVMVVLTTMPDAAAAEDLAERLLEERLVACANVLPGARSIYRWEGEVRRDEEALVILKTTRRALPRLRERFPALHPYDVPELIALDVVDGAEAYLEWVRMETGGAR
jgi:periplasmic divalent cation tolerance protein